MTEMALKRNMQIDPDVNSKTCQRVSVLSNIFKHKE